jgi:hypothetical protein
MLWVRISIRTKCTTLCDKVCQWLATGRWFSLCPLVCLFACLMMFNATFNNMSVISWSVLLLEETKGHRENHRPVASHWQTLSHNVVHLVLIEIRTHNINGSDMQELVVPIMISLIESCCLKGSYWTKCSYCLSWSHDLIKVLSYSLHSLDSRSNRSIYGTQGCPQRSTLVMAKMSACLIDGV